MFVDFQKFEEFYENISEENWNQFGEKLIIRIDKTLFERWLYEIQLSLNTLQYENTVKANDNYMLENQLNAVKEENGLLKDNVMKLEEENSTKVMKIIELKQEVEHISVREEAIIKENRYLHLISQADDSKDTEIRKLKALNESLTTEIQKLQTKLKEGDQKIESLQKQNDAEKSDFFRFGQDMKALMNEKNELTKEKNLIVSENENLQEELQKQNDAAESDLLRFGQDMKALMNEKNELTKEKNLIVSENENLQEKLQKSDQMLTEGRQELIRLKNELDEMTVQFQRNNETKERDTKYLEGKLIKAAVELTEWEAKYTVQCGKLEQVENNYKELQQLLHYRESHGANIHLSLSALQNLLEKDVRSTILRCFWKKKSEKRRNYIEILDKLFVSVDKAFRSSIY